MTKDEAQRECARLKAEDPAGLWAPQETAPGEWRVVRARVPGLKPRQPTRADVQPAPETPHPETDPQPRQLPYWLG